MSVTRIQKSLESLELKLGMQKLERIKASRLTAVDGLHLPVDGVTDHQGADEELGPPKKARAEERP